MADEKAETKKNLDTKFTMDDPGGMISEYRARGLNVFAILLVDPLTYQLVWFFGSRNFEQREEILRRNGYGLGDNLAENPRAKM